MKQKTDEITTIDIQLFATFLTLISVLVTAILLYNQKLLEEKKVPLFSKEDTLQYVAWNRLFVLLIVILFLSANYLQFKIDQEEQKNLTFDYLDIFSSVLTLVVACIAIYTSFKAIENQDLSIDFSADQAL